MQLLVVHIVMKVQHNKHHLNLVVLLLLLAHSKGYSGSFLYNNSDNIELYNSDEYYVKT